MKIYQVSNVTVTYNPRFRKWTATIPATAPVIKDGKEFQFVFKSPGRGTTATKVAELINKSFEKYNKFRGDVRANVDRLLSTAAISE